MCHISRSKHPPPFYDPNNFLTTIIIPLTSKSMTCTKSLKRVANACILNCSTALHCLRGRSPTYLGPLKRNGCNHQQPPPLPKDKFSYSQNNLRTTKSSTILYRNFYKHRCMSLFLLFLTWQFLSQNHAACLSLMTVCDSLHLWHYIIRRVLKTAKSDLSFVMSVCSSVYPQ
jgi:hypothetical protein